MDDTQTRTGRDLGSPEARNCGPAGSVRRCDGIHRVRRDSACSTDSVCPVVAREQGAELDRTSAGAARPRSGGPGEQRRSLPGRARDGGMAPREGRWTRRAGDRRARGQTAAQGGAESWRAEAGLVALASRAHTCPRLAGHGTPTCLNSGTLARYCVVLCPALRCFMATMRSRVILHTKWSRKRIRLVEIETLNKG